MPDNNYILFSNHRGALVYIPPCTSSVSWGLIRDAWERRFGVEHGFLSRSMEYYDVRNNVHIHETLYSAEGMGFSLTPLPGAADEAVTEAWKHLKATRDVAHIGINRILKWVDFTQEIEAVLNKAYV